MTRLPDPALAHAFEASWPPARTERAGGFLVGLGEGAGGRVSSARALPDWRPDDIPLAEAQHREWGQRPLFRAWNADQALIAALTDRGYGLEIPTLVLEAPVAALTDRPLPPVTGFALWPPLAIQRRIWEAGNINPARQAVMDRVALPKAALLGRLHDRAAAAGFVAAAGDVAMLHGLEVLPDFRRQGLAGWMVRQAAFWAAEQGAARLALAVSEGNAAARALYRGLGFTEAAGYGYYAPV
ncbi:GNAT family N-acetyltransferase [Paracoccus sp. (in: a-proteobacteria)]|uniref:GNAT family N-acetyltransferase n=1 Tax=Paracoccus sp. TaxID=267 RepID=UPI00272A4C3C|nr:GNAT family N-acetyltransferase [Paracoccus sp. (in: a-proteobacteria)]